MKKALKIIVWSAFVFYCLALLYHKQNDECIECSLEKETSGEYCQLNGVEVLVPRNTPFAASSAYEIALAQNPYDVYNTQQGDKNCSSLQSFVALGFHNSWFLACQ